MRIFFRFEKFSQALGDPGGVDAGSGVYSPGCEILVFRTALKRYIEISGDFPKRRKKFFHSPEKSLFPPGLEGRGEGSKTPFQRGIEVEKRKNAAACRRAERGGQKRKIFEMPGGRGFVAQDNGVVSPGDSGGPEDFSEFFHGVQNLFGFGNPGFVHSGISRKSDQEKAFQPPMFDLFEKGEKRSGIFGPENEGVHVFRGEGDPANLFRVAGVRYSTIALAKTIHEPGSIEGGNVRPPAGADDHSGSFLPEILIPGCFGCALPPCFGT